METEASVKAIVSDAVFKRAKDLIKAKRLQEVAFQADDYEKASAVCEGSTPGEMYDVSISIDSSDPAKHPSYKCSCPAGRGMCKHVVALLLYRSNIKNGDSTVEDTKVEEEEILETATRVEWVRNPEKIIPDPQAKRALPAWMTAATCEKPKKARASKKQKVEEETDEPQTSGRKPPATKRSSSSKGKEKVDAAEVEKLDDEEGSKTKTKAAPRRTKSNVDDSDQDKDKASSEQVQRRPRRTKDEEVNVSAGADRKRAKTPQSKRTLREIEEEDVLNETTDPTLDELMNIAQQNLDKRDSPGLKNVEDNVDPIVTNHVNATATQQAKKKGKLSDSLFSLSEWKSKPAGTSTGDGSRNSSSSKRGSHEDERIDTVGDAEALGTGKQAVESEQSIQEHQLRASEPSTAKLVSTDTLQDEMLGMLLGNYISTKVSSCYGIENNALQRAEPAIVRTDAAVPVEVPRPVATEAHNLIEEIVPTSCIQPKPKKKSSLKDQINMLLK